MPSCAVRVLRVKLPDNFGRQWRHRTREQCVSTCNAACVSVLGGAGARPEVLLADGTMWRCHEPARGDAYPMSAAQMHLERTRGPKDDSALWARNGLGLLQLHRTRLGACGICCECPPRGWELLPNSAPYKKASSGSGELSRLCICRKSSATDDVQARGLASTARIRGLSGSGQLASRAANFRRWSIRSTPGIAGETQHLKDASRLTLGIDGSSRNFGLNWARLLQRDL